MVKSFSFPICCLISPFKRTEQRLVIFAFDWHSYCKYYKSATCTHIWKMIWQNMFSILCLGKVIQWVIVALRYYSFYSFLYHIFHWETVFEFYVCLFVIIYLLSDVLLFNHCTRSRYEIHKFLVFVSCLFILIRTMWRLI